MAQGPQWRWLRPTGPSLGPCVPLPWGPHREALKKPGTFPPIPHPPQNHPLNPPDPLPPPHPHAPAELGLGSAAFIHLPLGFFFWFCPKSRGASQDGGCSSSSDAREARGGDIWGHPDPWCGGEGLGGFGTESEAPRSRSFENRNRALLGFWIWVFFSRFCDPRAPHFASEVASGRGAASRCPPRAAPRRKETPPRCHRPAFGDPKSGRPHTPNPF